MDASSIIFMSVAAAEKTTLLRAQPIRIHGGWMLIILAN